MWCRYCINSLAHLVGRRRYSCEFQTHCDARNNAWLALATLGEGWHNNHHCYMRSAKHGFYPHELDITYALLRGLAALRLVWDLELPPMHQVSARVHCIIPALKRTDSRAAIAGHRWWWLLMPLTNARLIRLDD